MTWLFWLTHLEQIFNQNTYIFNIAQSNNQFNGNLRISTKIQKLLILTEPDSPYQISLKSNFYNPKVITKTQK